MQPDTTPSIFIRKLYRLLLNKPEIFEIKKLSKVRGYCADDGSSIELDYRDEIISTLIHEALHYLHPDWSESKVLFHEKYLMHNFSKTQVKNIIKKFATAL